MILVDDRIGSKDLAKPLKAMGLPVEIARLDFGDVAFAGKGPQGSSLNIGVELKRLGDLVGSLRSGRLAGHQLPGLTEMYDYRWLLVEGYWQHNEAGQVVQYKGKARGWAALPGQMSASELEKQVLTMELCGGMHVRFCNSRSDSARFLSCLYRWWTDTALDRHTSHLAVHNAPTLVPISKFRQAVTKWPHIGIATSKAVETRFRGSLRDAAKATREAWASIEIRSEGGKVRRLGMKAASDIDRFLDGKA